MIKPEREVVLWHPPGGPVSPRVSALSRRVQWLGGAAALAEWQIRHPDLQVAYVHGERHDLWWEFSLWASFRWQAHLHGLSHDFLRQRLHLLGTGLNLNQLLGHRVEELTAAEQARANLAVALLPRPNLLLWEEPLCHLSPDETDSVVDFVRRRVAADRLNVIAVGTSPSGLARQSPLPAKRAAIQ